METTLDTSSGNGFLDGIGPSAQPDENVLSSMARDENVASVNDEKSESGQEEQRLMLNPVVSMIKDKFQRAKDRKQFDEERWLQCYDNYRGVYTSYNEKEKSKAVIKITKTKVQAAYSQVTEVLFSGQKFPIGIRPSKYPFGRKDKFSVKQKPGPKPKGKEDPKPENSVPFASLYSEEILREVGLSKNKLKILEDEGQINRNPVDPKSEVIFEPNKEASEKMEILIQDQLAETDANKEVRSFCFELAEFGHGIMKGPLGETKEYPFWSSTGAYEPQTDFVPKIKHVSIWDFYPDPDALTIEDCEFTIERYRYSKTQLRDLKRQKFFLADQIEHAINQGPDYVKEHWESRLEDSNQSRPDDRYQVLEYWGYLDRQDAEAIGIEIPPEFDEWDQVQTNIWVCNSTVIRAVMNPFKPSRIPYHSAPYEINPYSFWGVGVAENMIDTQTIMNGFMRLMVDNAVLSSNVVFEVDEDNLVPGQSMDVYPGKVFRRSGGAPGQAIFSTKFQNVTNECMLVFDKARQLSDEATGMPSYSHGMTGVNGVGRTASGMSMLMGAAAQNIKSVVRNIDDFLLIPLGKDLVAFNMQFNFDKEFVAEIEVVARGTESLMRNEVRSQKILQFLQLTANPLDAPFTNREYLLQELSKSLDIDSGLSINSTRDARIQAMFQAQVAQPMTEMTGQAGSQGGPQQQPMAGGPNGVPSPQGAETGGIGPAVPKVPDEQGFAANTGQMPQG